MYLHVVQSSGTDFFNVSEYSFWFSLYTVAQFYIWIIRLPYLFTFILNRCDIEVQLSYVSLTGKMEEVQTEIFTTKMTRDENKKKCRERLTLPLMYSFLFSLRRRMFWGLHEKVSHYIRLLPVVLYWSCVSRLFHEQHVWGLSACFLQFRMTLMKLYTPTYISLL